MKRSTRVQDARDQVSKGVVDVDVEVVVEAMHAARTLRSGVPSKTSKWVVRQHNKYTGKKKKLTTMQRWQKQ